MCLDSVLRHYETQLCKERSGYLGMSDTHRKRVEEVLLEGDLLEVTTDETTQIWQVGRERGDVRVCYYCVCLSSYSKLIPSVPHISH